MIRCMCSCILKDERNRGLKKEQDGQDEKNKKIILYILPILSILLKLKL